MAESSETLKRILKLIETPNPSMSDMGYTNKTDVLTDEIKKSMDKALMEELELLLTTFWTKTNMENKLATIFNPIETQEKSGLKSTSDIKAQHLLKYKENLIAKIEKIKQTNANTQKHLTEKNLEVKEFIKHVN